MAQDANKNLERARRHVERNKLRDAISEYQTVLELIPNHPEAIQMLGDLCLRAGDQRGAALYFGMQFDQLVETGDSARASAIFARHLKSNPQPPARLGRYAFLLQKQNKSTEAIEMYSAAAQLFSNQHDSTSEYECLQRIAQLDPENPARQVQLAKLAEELGNADAACRSYMRAAQLTQASGNSEAALDLFANAHRLSPTDRSVALLYAGARFHRGDAAGAVELLRPFAPPEPMDTAFLEIYGEALLQMGELEQARETLFTLYKLKPDGHERLFDVADKYLQRGQDEEAVKTLAETRDLMFAARAENAFASRMDRLVEAHGGSLALMEFSAKLYDQMNREVKYFDSLVKVFDLALETDEVQKACEAIDKLVEIDPYDYRIQERISRMEGKAPPEFVRGVSARAAKVTGGGAAATSAIGGGSFGDAVRAPVTEEEKAQRALDDLIVQAEIFLQYTLQSKAIERLERIAEMFPGEEERNDRLRMLYERANWWPKGSAVRPATASPSPAPAPIPEPVSAAEPTPPMATAADTHRDLAEIAEITRLMYREVTPREVLGTAVREIGKYLNVRRCLAVIGTPGETPQMTSEFASPGLRAAGAPLATKVAAALGKVPADAIGGISARSTAISELRSLDIETVLGVALTDKDTQAPSGILFIGDTASRQWKPNESYFLQAVGDQVMISVNHTRLRSLVRTLAVADEKTGLLGRGAYIDCLLAESKRSRTQGTPLSLVILQVDHGPEALREHGDAAMENYMNQMARSLESCIRQGDLGVKYTAWSLAFVLPDTTREKAEALAGKLRQTASQVQPAWAKSPLTLSAVVADASSRIGEEHEDRVTEWINRAEFGLEELRHRGGNSVASLAPR